MLILIIKEKFNAQKEDSIMLLNIFFKMSHNHKDSHIIQQKVAQQAAREYYERKVKFLNGRNLQPRLVLLTCYDVPKRPTSLKTKRELKRFVKKSIKYYEKKLREVDQPNGILSWLSFARS